MLDASGFSQNVHGSTHYFPRTLDLVLSLGTESEQLTVSPHNPVLSDQFLIPFQLTETTQLVRGIFIVAVSESAVTKLKVTLLLFSSLQCPSAIKGGNIDL